MKNISAVIVDKIKIIKKSKNIILVILLVR
jgi:hypothetical protein